MNSRPYSIGSSLRIRLGEAEPGLFGMNPERQTRGWTTARNQSTGREFIWGNDQFGVIPPSIVYTLPLIYAASSLQRKATSPATSSGDP